MILTIIKGVKNRKIKLPDDILGSYYITNKEGDILAIVYAEAGKWQVKANQGYKIVVNEQLAQTIILNEYSNFQIVDNIENKYFVYAYPSVVQNRKTVILKKNNLTIGSADNSIKYENPFVSPKTATLNYVQNNWILESDTSEVYVNGIQIKRKRVFHGDIIFIHGLKIVPVSNKLLIYNLAPNYKLNLDQNSFLEKQVDVNINPESYDIETERPLYSEDDYFIKAPRFNTAVEPQKIEIAAPPKIAMQKQQPAILTIGPQLTMCLTSGLSIITTMTTAISNNSPFTNVLPSIIVSSVMMISSFFWPTLARKYNIKEQKKQRVINIKTYGKYLEKKEQEIIEAISKEKQVAEENNISLEGCQSIIFNRKRNLWERNSNHIDFLNVRLGIGSVKPTTTIDYKENDFSIEDNMLVDQVKDLVNKYSKLENVPLNLSLVEKNITAVIGSNTLTQSFLNSILLQLFTFHSFTELKVVIFTNEQKASNWDYLRHSVHCFDNNKTIRFIGTNQEEIKAISTVLDAIYNERVEATKNTLNSDDENETKNVQDTPLYQKYRPYYIIIIDDLKLARNTEIVKKVLNATDNMGFSLIIKNDRISNLPSQCNAFLNINQDVSGLFENELIASKQKQFKAEFNTTVDMYGYIEKLANYPIVVDKAKYELPKSISFLDMYGVGRVEALNSIDRWKMNNPIASLSVPVGLDQNGDLFNMDAHEKAFGPHGLVAGTTGSGKSEWIITYILSLAINFHPEEVQFVLIDYKGGGLAGSFENSELGIRLPHLVGTITNLDKSEIRRSIASIESELKRRQRMFNEAREKLKDSSMNIYKYQDYYRKGLLAEPMSHLFIISDEFAELKSQQPEFMDQLISTARIGRSLGVHLILATQKPSGVVNDQIWSNSRFHVALRVQDPSDSNEMIKTPDAAFLKNTGSFYLQVGNNEFYAAGQSAYAGFKYVESDIVKKQIDTDIHIINNIGSEIASTSPTTVEDLNVSKEDKGEQLLNILKYVDGLAKERNINPRRLWLDRIPDVIFLDNIKKKYSFNKVNYDLKPIIGEYDDPYTQSQHAYTLDFSKIGNVALYGKQGSGKELLLESLIYSLSTTYTMQELQIYIMDFGAEILKVFENNPLVGNVVTIGEEDKIDGIFKYVKNAIRERKDLFSEYGGNYEQYIKTSGKAVPNILVIMNNFDSFKEVYEDMTDFLMLLMRECAKYGIYFLISNSQKCMAKITDNIGYTIVLNYDDEMLYKDIFGKIITPREAKCRGIAEVDGTAYEFQGAIPVDEDKINDTVKQLNKVLFDAYKTSVPSVPYLPKFVTYDYIKNQVTNMERVPVGIKRNTIRPEYVNFKKLIGCLITGKNSDSIDDFTRNLAREMATMKDSIYFFDGAGVYDEFFRDSSVTYIKDDFGTVMQNLYVYTEDLMKTFDPKENPDTKEHIYIVIKGLNKFMAKLKLENEKYLTTAVKNALQLKTISFIFIDNQSAIRDFGSSEWIDVLKDILSGIWIGPGANEQLIMEINKYDIRPSSNGFPDNFGYTIIGNKATQIKVLEDEKAEEEE